MHAIEEFARREGCLGTYLDTFEYQALPFYEKLGYEQLGVLEGYPPGYRQYHLKKGSSRNCGVARSLAGVPKRPRTAELLNGPV